MIASLQNYKLLNTKDAFFAGQQVASQIVSARPYSIDTIASRQYYSPISMFSVLQICSKLKATGNMII